MRHFGISSEAFLILHLLFSCSKSFLNEASKALVSALSLPSPFGSFVLVLLPPFSVSALFLTPAWLIGSQLFDT